MTEALAERMPLAFGTGTAMTPQGSGPDRAPVVAKATHDHRHTAMDHSKPINGGNHVEKIDLQEAKRLFDQGQAAFLDSRSPDSWGESDVQIPGAVRVPPDEVAQHLGDIPPASTLITYCT
jgi:hypothetical protein